MSRPRRFRLPSRTARHCPRGRLAGRAPAARRPLPGEPANRLARPSAPTARIKRSKSASRDAPTSRISSSVGEAPWMPHAMFEMSDMPSTLMPACRAAMTSSHTLMATVSAPSVRNARISARVSKLGPSTPRYTPSCTRTPVSAAASCAQRAQMRVEAVQHGEEALRHVGSVKVRNGIAPRQVDLVVHDAEVSHLVRRVDRARGIGGNQAPNAQARHQPHRERHVHRRAVFVAVQTAPAS